MKPGSGAAFDDLGSDSGELSQLSVIAADEGYVYITVTGPSGSMRFVAAADQARSIADAIKEAAGR